MKPDPGAEGTATASSPTPAESEPTLAAIRADRANPHALARRIAALDGGPATTVIRIGRALASDPAPELRRLGIRLIASRESAPEHVEVLLRALEDADASVRLEALSDLGRVEVAGKAPVAELSKALSGFLDSKDPLERVAAFRSLAERAPAVARKRLVATLKDADPRVRRAGVSAMVVLKNPPAEARALLSDRLSDSDPGVRRLTEEALELAGDSGEASSIASALAAAGDSLEAIFAIGMKLADEHDARTRPAAKSARERIAPAASGKADALGADPNLARLRDALLDMKRRYAAFKELKTMGAGATPLLPVIRDILVKPGKGESESMMLRELKPTLLAIGPAAAPFLLEVIADPKFYWPSLPSVFEILETWSPLPAESRARLEAILRGGDFHRLAYGAATFLREGLDVEPLIDRLIVEVGLPPSRDRSEYGQIAARALGEMGLAAARAVPALLAACADPKSDAAREAPDALAAMAALAPDTLGATIAEQLLAVARSEAKGKNNDATEAFLSLKLPPERRLDAMIELLGISRNGRQIETLAREIERMGADAARAADALALACSEKVAKASTTIFAWKGRVRIPPAKALATVAPKAHPEALVDVVRAALAAPETVGDSPSLCDAERIAKAVGREACMPLLPIAVATLAEDCPDKRDLALNLLALLKVPDAAAIEATRPLLNNRKVASAAKKALAAMEGAPAKPKPAAKPRAAKSPKNKEDAR